MYQTIRHCTDESSVPVTISSAINQRWGKPLLYYSVVHLLIGFLLYISYRVVYPSYGLP